MRGEYIMKLILITLLSISNISMAKEVALLIRYRGSVEIDGKAVKLGQKIKEGAKVDAIGEKSFAQLRFKKGHTVRIVNGHIIVKEIKKEATILELVRGKIYNHVKKLSKGQKFEIKTKYAAIGVRGTKFSVDQGKEASHVAVIEGTVYVIKTSLLKEEFSLKAGNQLSADASKIKLKSFSIPDEEKKNQIKIFDEVENKEKDKKKEKSTKEKNGSSAGRR